MKRLSLLFLGIFAGLLLVGSFVHAQPDINSLTTDVAKSSGYDTTQVNDLTLSQTVGRIIRVALSLVGTIFFVLMIYAGFLWMTAQGDDEQVNKAIGIIKTSTVGLIVVLAAYGLSAFLVGVVSLTSGAPSSGSVGPGYGTGGFWSSFGTSLKDNWWNFAF